MMSLANPIAQRPSAPSLCIDSSDDELSAPTEEPLNSRRTFMMSLATPIGKCASAPPTSTQQQQSDKLTVPTDEPQRPRRTYSPAPSRSKPKVSLRPCLCSKRRGTTSQTPRESTTQEWGLLQQQQQAAAILRGRTKVRFSQAPPVEVRTHSPVEYDRKPCPVSNRLSPEDLEELRQMNMEMGLLEARRCEERKADEANAAEIKPTRPGVHPLSTSPPSPPSPMLSILPSPSICGYDSPASEFCYESGSEYDLCG